MGALAAVLVSLTLGNWQVTFRESDARLELVNATGEASVSGTLAFTSGDQAWSVVAPRDAVTNRLALLDLRGNVQGYLTFQGEGDRLSLRVCHRTAQNYEGQLSLVGSVAFTPDSFACRTQPVKGSRVLQLGTGRPDTDLNDSLFDPERDHAMLLRGGSARRFATQGNGRYGLTLDAAIREPSEAVWSFTVERDYYRTRYVPYYTPINRARCPSPPTGWMSWNTYFDKATAEDNLAEARVGQKHLQPFGMEFWHIESWQDNSDSSPVYNFDNLSLTPNPNQFPLGMKHLADDIRALGFRPGLWTVPFGTGSTNFYLAHKEWFLHGPDGKPIRSWSGRFAIDPTHPEVINHVREIHRIASREWGYEYFKIDGMSGRSHAYSAHFFERPEIRACFKDPTCQNPFERCVKALREGIGEDRVFLACQGHYTGPEAAYADAYRAGADIVNLNVLTQWRHLQNQARCTLNQIFVHNIVFFADPDTLMVGDYISIEEARLAATVVALPGQMMFSGDKLAGLKPERMRLLQQALPVCDVRPLDLFPVFDMLPVWALHVRRPFAEWQVVALFNWDEKEAELGFAFDELGLDAAADYAVYEFWTGTYQGERKARFDMPVPGHGVRLLAVHRAQAVPHFLSSDRHVTQGGVELTSLAWDGARNALTGAVKAVKDYPVTLRFRAPQGFALASAQAGAGIPCQATVETGGVVAVKLLSPASQEVPFTLSWK